MLKTYSGRRFAAGGYCEGMLYFAAWVACVVVFAMLGAYVASQCGRSVGEGVLLGALIGPVGVIIVALLPRPVRRQPIRRLVECTEPESTADDEVIQEWLTR